MLAQGNQSIFLLFGYCCSVIKLCGSYAGLSNVPTYGTFCCDFHSPFADNQTPLPRLTRRLEKNLYSSLAFDTYFPWKEKRQAQNFSWLKSKCLNYRTRKSKAHIMACTVEDIISPFKCSAYRGTARTVLMAVLNIYHSFQWRWTMQQRKKRKWLYVVSLLMMHTKSLTICISKKRITCRNLYLKNNVLPLIRNAVYISIN